MHANVGDTLVISDRGTDHERKGTIMEVGDGGRPPYLVRFPDGHETSVFPGPDCIIEPA